MRLRIEKINSLNFDPKGYSKKAVVGIVVNITTLIKIFFGEGRQRE